LDGWYIGIPVQQDTIFNNNSGKITEFLIIFFILKIKNFLFLALIQPKFQNIQVWLWKQSKV
jgi:hypothetical protein